MTHEGIEISVVTVTQEDDYSLRVFTLKVKSLNMSHNRGTTALKLKVKGLV